MNKKLKCILRMIELDYYYEFTEWMVEHKIIIEEDLVGLTRDLEKAEFIDCELRFALKEGKMQLLDFEWSLLPLEVIKIICVTETTKKEFTHGY